MKNDDFLANRDTYPSGQHVGKINTVGGKRIQMKINECKLTLVRDR